MALLSGCSSCFAKREDLAHVRAIDLALELLFRLISVWWKGHATVEPLEREVIPAFKAHRLLYRSNLGSRVITKKKTREVTPERHGQNLAMAVLHVPHSPYTLNPAPYTLHPTPCTLHREPYTLHTKSYIMHPTPYTLHPTPYTLHSLPYIMHPTH